MKFIWEEKYETLKKQMIENLSLPSISNSDKERYIKILNILENLLKGNKNKNKENIFTEEAQKKLNDLPLVLNHNDVFWENVLMMKKSKELTLIDFELSVMSYFGSDLLVIISEIMSDYSSDEAKIMIDDIPSDSDLKEMIKFYSFFYFKPEFYQKFTDKEDLADTIRNLTEYKEFDHPVLEKVFELLPLLKIINHSYWIWRAVFAIQYSKSDKDYLNWGNKRVQMLFFDYPELKV